MDAQTPLKESPLADWYLTTIMELRRHRERIEDALDFGPGNTHTFDDIVAGVMTGRFLFHSYDKSVLISEVQEYPQEVHWHVFLGAGDLEELKVAHEELVPVAKAAGCTVATICGRRGWARAFKDLGWEPSLYSLSKEL